MNGGANVVPGFGLRTPGHTLKIAGSPAHNEKVGVRSQEGKEQS